MWKAKIVFLLIVYFAGFATAIYYLAPDGRMDCQAAEYPCYSDNSGANGVQNSAAGGGALKQMCEKAYSKAAAGLMGMKEEDFKEAFDRGMEAIKEMAKEGQSIKTKSAGNR